MSVYNRLEDAEGHLVEMHLSILHKLAISIPKSIIRRFYCHCVVNLQLGEELPTDGLLLASAETKPALVSLIEVAHRVHEVTQQQRVLILLAEVGKIAEFFAMAVEVKSPSNLILLLNQMQNISPYLAVLSCLDGR